MLKAVTIFIPEDKDIEGIRLKPFAATAATTSSPSPVGGGTSQATAQASFVPPASSDVTGDITYDL